MIAGPTRGVGRLVGLLVLGLVAGVLSTPGSAAALPASAAAEPGGAVGGGTWHLDRDRSGVVVASWATTAPLPVTSDHPEVLVDGRPLGATRVSPDRLRVTAVGPVDGVLDDARFDILLSGRLLDEPTRPDRAPAAAVRSPDGALLATDPATPGPHAVRRTAYDRGEVSLDGMTEVEVAAHVVGPADTTGPRPVVVFLHGQHSWCYEPGNPDSDLDTGSWPCVPGAEPVPNHLGYRYLQELLASQGYLTVSISANGVNAQDERPERTSASARAALVRHHLDLLAEHPTELDLPAAPDLSQVVLVGHSRGGAGMARVSATVPLDAPYRIAGQVLLAPTNIQRQTAAYVPTFTVLGFCDGDVSDLEGQLYTDLARDVTSDDVAPHSSVLVMGANHNFFNTEWTPGQSAAPSLDDRGDTVGYCAPGAATRLAATEQQQVARVYVAAAVRYVTGDAAYWPLFDGSGSRVRSIADVDVRSHDISSELVVLRPGQESTAVSDGAEVSLCSGRMGSDGNACLRGGSGLSRTSPHFVSPHERHAPALPAAALRWTEPRAGGGLAATRPLDLSGHGFLDLRVLLPIGADDTRFDVALATDGGEATTVVPAHDGLVGGVPKPQHLSATVAQTLRVDLEKLDPASLRAVREVLLVPRTDRGRAWLLDASVADEVPVPPDEARRLPTVAIASIEAVEGDEPTQLAVPFRLSAPAPEGARILVTSPEHLYYRRGGTLPPFESFEVALPVGAESGTIQVPLAADDVHDHPHRLLPVEVFPLRNVMTATSQARLRIIDDDPRPRFRIVAPSTREGRTVTLRVGWAEPVGFDIYVEIWFRRPAEGPPLRVADLPRAFRRKWLGPGRHDPRDVLAGRRYSFFTSIPAGREERRFTLPLRLDGTREGREGSLLTARVPRSDIRAQTELIVRD